MVYYKVKPEADQTRVKIQYSYQILVANELYTKREIEKAKRKITPEFLDKNFTKIEASPKKTFFFFGARFQTSK